AVRYGEGAKVENNFAKYAWNFGDGSAEVTGFAPGTPPCEEAGWLSPCAASVTHSYQYGGTYNVELTVTDVGGNVASVTRQIEVSGPPPPSSEGGGGSGGGSGSGGSGGGSGSGTTSTTTSPAGTSGSSPPSGRSGGGPGPP